MASKLFIGNIPYDATEDQLKDHFGQAGEVVSVAIITDRMSGRPKGFGFVEMADDAAAEKAMQELDGKDFMDRPLAVKEARPPRQDYQN